jgi:hypothetical protein
MHHRDARVAPSVDRLVSLSEDRQVEVCPGIGRWEQHDSLAVPGGEQHDLASRPGCEIAGDRIEHTRGNDCASIQLTSLGRTSSRTAGGRVIATAGRQVGASGGSVRQERPPREDVRERRMTSRHARGEGLTASRRVVCSPQLPAPPVAALRVAPTPNIPAAAAFQHPRGPGEKPRAALPSAPARHLEVGVQPSADTREWLK